MAHYLSLVVLAVAVVVVTDAGGHGQGRSQGNAEESADSRMSRGGRGQWGGNQDQGGFMRNQQGGNQPNNDQAGGRQGGSDSRYTANIFNDDEVYGYEAKYPNGEALYVSYRNSEARARRGPGFARSNSISSRSSGMNSDGHQDEQGGYRQQRSGMGAEQRSQHQQQPQW